MRTERRQCSVSTVTVGNFVSSEKYLGLRADRRFHLGELREQDGLLDARPVSKQNGVSRTKTQQVVIEQRRFHAVTGVPPNFFPLQMLDDRGPDSNPYAVAVNDFRPVCEARREKYGIPGGDGLAAPQRPERPRPDEFCQIHDETKQSR